MTYSVIIPTLNPGPGLSALISSLRCQAESPQEIIIVDSASADGTPVLAASLGCRVLSISQTDFTHGGSRNLGARAALGDALIFMTQDAMPVNTAFTQELLRPLREGLAVAGYGRQIARSGASLREQFTRAFNYPAEDELRTRETVARLGVGAYFFSNVASAVRADIFHELGLFNESVIMNEDMLFCAAVLDSGWSVAYVAKACVFHSHDYGLFQTFRRYFDVGVFFARHFNRPALATQGRGTRYSILLLRMLSRKRAWLELCMALAEIGAKFVGYNLGRHERIMPIMIKRRMSMHRAYWTLDQRGIKK